MPTAVLERARLKMLDWQGSWHIGDGDLAIAVQIILRWLKSRGKFTQAHGYQRWSTLAVLQGGATLQLSAIPLNLMNGGGADYLETGTWSNTAS